MLSLLIIPYFSLLYAIKGGQGAYIFKNWTKIKSKNKILDRALSGKVLSTLGVAVLAFLSFDLYYAVSLPLAWLAAVSPAVGAEHGAVGDYKGWWGEYNLKQFGRRAGIIKAVMRGTWMGACFSIVTLNALFLWASLLFVPCVFAGQCLNRLILKDKGWTLAEPLIGAVVFGIPYALWGGL